MESLRDLDVWMAAHTKLALVHSPYATHSIDFTGSRRKEPPTGMLHLTAFSGLLAIGLADRVALLWPATFTRLGSAAVALDVTPRAASVQSKIDPHSHDDQLAVGCCAICAVARDETLQEKKNPVARQVRDCLCAATYTAYPE